MRNINYNALIAEECSEIKEQVLLQMKENLSRVIKNPRSKKGRLTLAEKPETLKDMEKPCMYRWLASENSKKIILSHVEDKYSAEIRKIIEENKCEVNGVTYYALYFGKSKNGRNRIINSHLRGTTRTSTLRYTLLELCKGKDIKDNDVDILFEDSCFQWLILDQDSKDYIDCLESISIALGNYLLNIEGNPSISDDWRNHLMGIRGKEK